MRDVVAVMSDNICVMSDGLIMFSDANGDSQQCCRSDFVSVPGSGCDLGGTQCRVAV